MRLKDKIAIVTGGATGIGEAISSTFASEGATVVVASRSLPNLEKQVKKIEAKGGKARAIATDLADEKQIQSLVAQTIDEYGRVDILVNNAAAMQRGDVNVVDMPVERWNEALRINLTGTMLCTREVLKNMIPRKSGAIVNISSVAGVIGNPGRSPYAVTKWGIIGFTETLAIEVGPYNIRVNAVSPAATGNERFGDNVRMLAERLKISPEAMMDKILSHYSLRRINKPEEVATAVLFLASDDSSAVTGQNIIVSCGFHMLNPNEIK